MKSLQQYILENKEELTNRIEEIKSKLVGKTISDVEKMLGYWWTLDNQTKSNKGGFVNHYSRNVQGKLNIYTDKENIVYDVDGSWYRKDSPFENA